MQLGRGQQGFASLNGRRQRDGGIPSPVERRMGLIAVALLFLVLRGLLAFGAEFLALLAMKSLVVSLLGAFDRFGAMDLGGLRRGCRRGRIRLGGGRRGGLGENGGGEKQQRRA